MINKYIILACLLFILSGCLQNNISEADKVYTIVNQDINVLISTKQTISPDRYIELKELIILLERNGKNVDTLNEKLKGIKIYGVTDKEPEINPLTKYKEIDRELDTIISSESTITREDYNALNQKIENIKNSGLNIGVLKTKLRLLDVSTK